MNAKLILSISIVGVSWSICATFLTDTRSSSLVTTQDLLCTYLLCYLGHAFSLKSDGSMRQCDLFPIDNIWAENRTSASSLSTHWYLSYMSQQDLTWKPPQLTRNTLSAHPTLLFPFHPFSVISFSDIYCLWH